MVVVGTEMPPLVDLRAEGVLEEIVLEVFHCRR